MVHLEVSINGGIQKWLVYKGKSHLEMDDPHLIPGIWPVDPRFKQNPLARQLVNEIKTLVAGASSCFALCRGFNLVTCMYSKSGPTKCLVSSTAIFAGFCCYFRPHSFRNLWPPVLPAVSSVWKKDLTALAKTIPSNTFVGNTPYLSPVSRVQLPRVSLPQVGRSLWAPPLATSAGDHLLCMRAVPAISVWSKTQWCQHVFLKWGVTLNHPF